MKVGLFALAIAIVLARCTLNWQLNVSQLLFIKTIAIARIDNNLQVCSHVSSKPHNHYLNIIKYLYAYSNAYCYKAIAIDMDHPFGWQYGDLTPFKG